VTFQHDGDGEAARGRVREALDTLDAHGYRIFFISPDGRDYSFIRTDFPAP
jgi:hypothetical protein